MDQIYGWSENVVRDTEESEQLANSLSNVVDQWCYISIEIDPGRSIVVAFDEEGEFAGYL